jgi:hypothetical protein
VVRDSVRIVGCDGCADKGDGVDRDGHVLSGDRVGVSKTGHQGGVKVRKGGGADNDLTFVSLILYGLKDITYHVAKDEGNSPPVADSQTEGLSLAHSYIAFDVCLDAALPEACDSDSAFSVGEPLGIGGEVQQDEVCGNRPDDGRSSLNNEQPSPSEES